MGDQIKSKSFRYAQLKESPLKSCDAFLSFFLKNYFSLFFILRNVVFSIRLRKVEELEGLEEGATESRYPPISNRSCEHIKVQ